MNLSEVQDVVMADLASWGVAQGLVDRLLLAESLVRDMPVAMAVGMSEDDPYVQGQVDILRRVRDAFNDPYKTLPLLEK